MAESTIGRRVARAVATALAAGALVAGVAACEPPRVPPRPPTPRPPVTTTTAPTPVPAVLEVTYRPGGSGSTSLTYTVRCGPGTTASITPAVRGLDARRACTTVAAQRTLLVEGLPRGLVCTAQYFGPETARLTGHVGGAPVDQRLARYDGCVEGYWVRVGDLVLRPPAGTR